MRKFFSLITATVLSTTALTQVVACQNPFYDPSILRVMVVTDGHTIDDNSFNQASYQGALKFQSEFSDWVKSQGSTAPADLKQKRVVVNWDNPQTTDLSSLIRSYSKSVFMNTTATVATGFLQTDALVRAQNQELKNKMRYVLVDGDTPNNQVPEVNKNLAGLLYKTEESGLTAGLAAAVYLAANQDQFGGANNLKITTYGGIDIPAVTSYMYGFYWAIQLFNHPTPELKTLFQEMMLKLNPSAPEQLPTINFFNLPNQFTGNFVQASDSSKAINSQIASNDVDVVFPVAGPQISDTLASLQKKGNGKVVGVDTDQQKQYPTDANRFITSAFKDVTSSVNYMLWRAIGYDETPEHNQISKEDQDVIFKNNAEYHGGKGWTGVADNEAIHPIYDDLTGTTLSDLLQKVTDGWTQVLNHGSDFWNYGKTINPFADLNRERGRN